MNNVTQGEVWFADLEPATGSEQAGVRPVVIISGNTLNETLPIAIVVPLTSKIKSYPACVRIASTPDNGLTMDSEAIAFQVRAVSKKRLTKRLGSLTDDELQRILKVLALVLTQ
jgi:mRNA interferase MazF